MLSGFSSLLLTANICSVRDQQLSLAGMGMGTHDPIKLGDYVGALRDAGWSGAAGLDVPKAPQGQVSFVAVAAKATKPARLLDSVIKAVVAFKLDGNIGNNVAVPLGLTKEPKSVPTKFKGYKMMVEGQLVRRRIDLIGGGEQIVISVVREPHQTSFLTDPSGVWTRAITGTDESDVKVLPLNQETEKEFNNEKNWWIKQLGGGPKKP